ncbi:MAG: protein YgfX [Gammaproteobacteria bacterium]
MPPAIDLVIEASPGLACSCALAHAAAIAAVVLSGIGWPIRAVLIFVLLTFAAWWILARALALAPRSIVRFVWRSDGECEWRERNGEWRSGSLAPGGLALPALVVLRLRGKRRPRTLCLACDGVDGEALRRLRMRLGVSPPPLPPSVLRRLLDWLRQGLAKWREQGDFTPSRRKRADR